MPRYIDAEALDAYVTYDRCNLCRKYALDRQGVRCKYCLTQWFLDAIDRHGTVDVEKVVRCRDCKYYYNSDEMCEMIASRLGSFNRDDIRWNEDFYCAFGERKTDGEIH